MTGKPRKKKPAKDSAVDPWLIEELARYRLLTIEQAHSLGPYSKETVGERFRVMARRGLVEMFNQPRFVGPRVHWLKPKGATRAVELAEERGETLRFTASKSGYAGTEQLPQRVSIVDCHISLRKWAEAAGATVEWFGVDFEASPNGQLTKALRYPWALPDGRAGDYLPDGAGVVRLADDARFLFGLEVETGGKDQRIENFNKKLPGRLAAFEAGALETGVEQSMRWRRGNGPDAERRARLLFVFTDAAMLTRARGILAKHTSNALPFVFLNTLPNVCASFGDGWVKPSGEQGNPFRSQ